VCGGRCNCLAAGRPQLGEHSPVLILRGDALRRLEFRGVYGLRHHV
jgi:hypothetical protein